MKHELALWAGLTALFTNLTAIAAVDIIGSNNQAKIISILITSVIVGATVYSKQRMDDAKSKREK